MIGRVHGNRYIYHRFHIKVIFFGLIVFFLPFKMTTVNMFKFPTSSPADSAPLERLKEKGFNASQILAVIGKTEGSTFYISNQFIGADPVSITTGLWQ